MKWSVENRGREIAIAVGMTIGLGLVGLATGCDRGEEPTAQKPSEPRPDTSAEKEPDSGSAQPAEEKKDWSDKVNQALEKGKKEVEREEQAEKRQTCQFFPDNCPRGKSCVSTRSGAQRCAKINPGKEPGDRCSAANDCGDGQQCVGGRPGTCLEMCNPENLRKWGCPSSGVCTRVADPSGGTFSWGVCRARRDECTPWPNDSCEIGEACLPTKVGLRCSSYSAASVGDRCRSPEDCDVGQTCVRENNGPLRCRRKCDAEHPCEAGACATIQGRSYGFCSKGSSPTQGGGEGK